MDGETALSRAAFLQMVERCLPREGRPPFDVLPWDPAVHPVFFVHRVAGLDPGAYVLVRDPGARALLEATLPGDPSWREVEDAPGVPLFRLRAGDLRGDAAAVSCDQGIAGNGAFAVAMLARFDQLEARGPWFYRALHWEAGALGQVLYLEAEAAGVQGTGIGCFFDEGTHELLGMTPGALRVVYHFTVGGGVHDPRLQTLPAYPARSVDQEGEGEEGDAGEPLGGA